MPTTSPSYTQEDGVSLKEFMEVQIAALRDHIDTRMNAVETSTAVAAAAMNRRLEGMNEIRGSLRDTVANQVTRDRCEQRHVVLDNQIDELVKYRNTMEGKASQQSVTTVTIIAILSLFISGAGLALKLMGG